MQIRRDFFAVLVETVGMKRYLDDLVATDLTRKMVLVTGPRQVGKTTLCLHLLARFQPSQYLNWDVGPDRAIFQRQSWNPQSSLLAMDEIHKMPGWKNWLKGVVDGRSPGQALLVTGSARMETWRQSGDSLAGRYLVLSIFSSSRELGLFKISSGRDCLNSVKQPLPGG